jgi:hypothetical protein
MDFAVDGVPNTPRTAQLLAASAQSLRTPPHSVIAQVPLAHHATASTATAASGSASTDAAASSSLSALSALSAAAVAVLGGAGSNAADSMAELEAGRALASFASMAGGHSQGSLLAPTDDLSDASGMQTPPLLRDKIQEVLHSSSMSLSDMPQNQLEQLLTFIHDDTLAQERSRGEYVVHLSCTCHFLSLPLHVLCHSPAENAVDSPDSDGLVDPGGCTRACMFLRVRTRHATVSHTH